jgi:Transglycosylase SLT domain
MRYALFSLLGMFVSGFVAFSGSADYFEPQNRLSGVGVDREHMSQAVLERRSDLMVESQSFTILRDPRALAGAERITSPKLQKIFKNAERQSGLPASFIAAVAYLESWGIANAESPAGPKGIMQFAEGTARSMGLKIIRKTKYRVYKERRLVRTRRGKPVYKTVKRKEPYTVLVRDDRFYPERAAPAAARYLARLEAKFGGRDWAVFAYHCGEGCAQEVQSVARQSRGLSDRPLTVASVFFGAHPGYNQDLYRVLRRHMERDYSPTYYFRIRRAEQLLNIYQEDPKEFRRLFDEYRNRANPNERAPHRLSVWLKPEDLEFQNCEDLKRNMGKKLMRALDKPEFFGFSLRKSGPGSIGERDPLNREY